MQSPLCTKSRWHKDGTAKSPSKCSITKTNNYLVGVTRIPQNYQFASVNYPCSSLALPLWTYFRKRTLSFGFILNLKAWKDMPGFKGYCQHCAWLCNEHIQHTGVKQS